MEASSIGLENKFLALQIAVLTVKKNLCIYYLFIFKIFVYYLLESMRKQKQRELQRAREKEAPWDHNLS